MKKSVNFLSLLAAQSTADADCWLLGFQGLVACKRCGLRGTKKCEGGKTLKKLQQKRLNPTSPDHVAGRD